VPKRMGREQPAERGRNEETGFFEAYAAFARTLRLWFIAYGIGGPAAFLTNEAAGQKLYASGEGRPIAYAFLAGVVLQIAMALIYKSAMWYLYVAEYQPTFKSSRRYNIAYKVSEAFWLEASADAVTLALFGGATLRLVRVFLA
jgi:hypothetical protein